MKPKDKKKFITKDEEPEQLVHLNSQFFPS